MILSGAGSDGAEGAARGEGAGRRRPRRGSGDRQLPVHARVRARDGRRRHRAVRAPGHPARADHRRARPGRRRRARARRHPRSGARAERGRLQRLQAGDHPPPPAAARRGDGDATASRATRGTSKTTPRSTRGSSTASSMRVTDFMRDPDLFQALGSGLLPGARRACPQAGRRAAHLVGRVLDRGGGVLDRHPLRRAARRRARTGRVRVFATDINAEAIAKARYGIYPASALVGLSEERVARYFVRLPDGRYQIKKQLRSCVVFGEHDLGQRAPFPRIESRRLPQRAHLLLDRAPAARAPALRLRAPRGGLHGAGQGRDHRPAGRLLRPRRALLQGLRAARRPGPDPQPAAAAGSGCAGSPARCPPRRGRSPRPPVAAALPLPRAPFEAVLTSLPLGVVIIDRRYDILEINLAARRLLAIHTPALGEDFVHLAHLVPHRDLLGLIEGAFRGTSPAPVAVRVEPLEAGPPRHLQITCFPQHIEAASPSTACALVLVTDVTLSQSRIDELELAAASESAAKVELAADGGRAPVGGARATEENGGSAIATAELRAAVELAAAAKRREPGGGRAARRDQPAPHHRERRAGGEPRAPPQRRTKSCSSPAKRRRPPTRRWRRSTKSSRPPTRSSRP